MRPFLLIFVCHVPFFWEIYSSIYLIIPCWENGTFYFFSNSLGGYSSKSVSGPSYAKNYDSYALLEGLVADPLLNLGVMSSKKGSWSDYWSSIVKLRLWDGLLIGALNSSNGSWRPLEKSCSSSRVWQHSN